MSQNKNTIEPNDSNSNGKDGHVVARVAALLRDALDHRRGKDLLKAETLATEALVLSQQELGERHLTTAYALTDLAIIQEDLHKLVEARDNLIAALDILEPTLGNHHEQVSLIFTRLHHLYM